jgi:tetratricopeptide (TPR) repeat protein
MEIGIAFLWLVLSIVAGIIASGKGRFGFGYFLIAVFLSPLVGIILAAALPSLKPDLEKKAEIARSRPCPHCGEMIKFAAVVCRFCGRAVEAATPPKRDPLDDINWTKVAFVVVTIVIIIAIYGAGSKPSPAPPQPAISASASSTEPSIPPAYSRGVTAMEASNFSEAIKDFTEAIANGPADIFAYTSRGRAYERVGDRPHALADYQKARTMTNDPALTRDILAAIKRTGGT